MKMEVLSANVHLKQRPKTGKQAFEMVVESLTSDIREKQDILSQLNTEQVKQRFIESWNPNVKSVSINDV